MDVRISKTNDGIKTYPLHTHNHYEIMLYTQGVGKMITQNGVFKFSPGTIIIIPPKIEHGSTSNTEFKNISISGDFESYFSFKTPLVFDDLATSDGQMLANLIYENRFNNNDYLYSLLSAYLHFLLLLIKENNQSELAINKITLTISNQFSDPELNLTALLNESGYSEDYARALFKQKTGKTPIEFLTEIRIKHACFLIDIYSNSLSLEKIAEQSGFLDYSYFSKKFKTITGISPRDYKKINFKTR